MKAIGLDIGTTTLSAALIDGESGELLRSLTLPYSVAVESEPWARLRDPERIWEKARAALKELCVSGASRPVSFMPT